MRIGELYRQLRGGGISAREVAQLCLSRIAASGLNAYITVCEQRALSAADEADRALRRGDADILCGVPVSVKDNIIVGGVENTCASRMLRGYVPTYDSTVWRLLGARGAVLTGKTNMDEFGMGADTSSSCFGGVLNPHGGNCLAGGSSGGAAAAVADGLCAYSVCSDTGGSARLPAAFCGCVGLCPTYGAVSRFGLVAYASSFDRVGIIASCAQDVQTVFSALSRPDTRDATCAKGGRGSVGDAKTTKGAKIAVLAGMYTECDEAAVLTLRAARCFEELGASVEYVDDSFIRNCCEAYYILACCEATTNLMRYTRASFASGAQTVHGYHERVAKLREELFGAEVLRRIQLGAAWLSDVGREQYRAAAEEAAGVKRAFSALFEKYDALLTPCTPHTAPKTRGEKPALPDYYTAPSSLCGLPAVSFPAGSDKNNIPFGVQLTGAKHSEHTLLEMVKNYEARHA